MFQQNKQLLFWPNGVQVNEKEAKDILELLHLVAKKSSNLKEISNTQHL